MASIASSAEIDSVAEIFTRDPENAAVCCVDGWGITVTTNAGRLVVSDGIGRHRRTRTYAKATHGLSRLVILGETGHLTLDAIDWLHGTGIAWARLRGSSGELIATSAKRANDDPRLRRVQALALGTPVGLAVAKCLIDHKLRGQAGVARSELTSDAVARSIEELAARLEEVESIDEVRQVEATAANLYWSAWSNVRPTFVRRDAERVPSGWLVFDGRRSAVQPGSARHSTDVVNSSLNYAYRLLEVEGHLAVTAIGLDPTLGVLHADMKGQGQNGMARASFVLDVIEAARPIVDRHVLRLVRSHPLKWRDFDEDERGVVRVLAPLSHRLAEAMPSFGLALAPIVEEVARLLATSSPYDVAVPTVLTHEKHRQAARRRQSPPTEPRAGIGPGSPGLVPRSKRRQRPREATATAAMPHPACRMCGVVLDWEPDRQGTRAQYCGDCTPGRRREIGVAIQQTPAPRNSTSPAANAKRLAKNTAIRTAELAWEKEHDKSAFDPVWFSSTIQPALAGVSLTRIAKETGMSTSAASAIRTGKRVPHPRHWPALAALTGDRGEPIRPDDPGGSRCPT